MIDSTQLIDGWEDGGALEGVMDGDGTNCDVYVVNYATIARIIL
jgi:hypothetical protein